MKSESILIIIFFIFNIISIVSCDSDEKPIIFTAEEIQRLISGDSSKIWIRTGKIVQGQSADLSNCELYLTTEFAVDESDSLKFKISFNPGRNLGKDLFYHENKKGCY